MGRRWLVGTAREPGGEAVVGRRAREAGGEAVVARRYAVAGGFEPGDRAVAADRQGAGAAGRPPASTRCCSCPASAAPSSRLWMRPGTRRGCGCASSPPTTSAARSSGRSSMPPPAKLFVDEKIRITVPEDRYGLYAIDSLDPDMIMGDGSVYYYHDMIVQMIKWGYQEGKTLFGFGYDFRQSNRMDLISGLALEKRKEGRSRLSLGK